MTTNASAQSPLLTAARSHLSTLGVIRSVFLKRDARSSAYRDLTAAINFFIEYIQVHEGKDITGLKEPPTARESVTSLGINSALVRLERGDIDGATEHLKHVLHVLAFSQERLVPLPAEELYWRLHSLSKSLEGSGRLDKHSNPDAYATILDAMKAVNDRNTPEPEFPVLRDGVTKETPIQFTQLPTMDLTQSEDKE